MTDEIARRIVVRFDERPDDQVVVRLKEAGFNYRPEYFGQEKVWTRSNNIEGRELVVKFEAFLTGLCDRKAIPFYNSVRTTGCKVAPGGLSCYSLLAVGDPV